jgi:hypothetical protein
MEHGFPFELLSAYIDNELSDQQRKMVEEHLRTCQECRREVEEMRNLDGHVRQREVEEPSRDFVFTLNRRVLERIRKRPRFSIWRVMPVLVPVAVAALVFVVITNTAQEPRLVGLDYRMSYVEEKADGEKEAVSVEVPAPRISRCKVYTVSLPVKKEMGKSYAGAPPASRMAYAEKSAKDKEADEERTLIAAEAEMEIPRDQVIRAIVDSTGRVLRVATGNTMIPEDDSALARRLEGQQLAPPTIRGRPTQMYVDLSPDEMYSDEETDTNCTTK